MPNDNSNIIQPIPSTSTPPGKSIKRVSFLGILISFAILVFILLLGLDYLKIISLSKIFSPKSISPTSSPFLTTESVKQQSAIIAKVGEENIYQKDLDTELAYYPDSKNVDTKKLLLQKIAKDSIILQAGEAERIIQLDSTVYNSVQKDYGQRMALVKQIQKMIESRQDRISGSIISIWFYNTGPGTVGYEKGKQIAFSKITSLYNDVKANKLTIKQAAQKIQNDSSLVQVDTSYQSNAIFDFDAGPKDDISYDPAFEAIIRKLDPGQLSPIYLAKDKDNSGMLIDAVYMFAQVTDRKADGHPEGFDQWVAQKQKAYEINIY